MILRGIVGEMFGTNCFIIGDEETKETIIIDPGDGADTILEQIKELDLKVTLIVATHSHMDHIGALAGVKEGTGAPFAMHAEDVPGLNAHGGMMSSMSGSAAKNPEPDRFLKGGDVIELGKLKFTVFHTPGHSPGGICLVGEGIAVSGDTLFNYSIGRTDFPGCSQELLMDSIHTKLMVLPDDTLVLPGHGPTTTIGDEREGNPFLRDGMS